MFLISELLTLIIKIKSCPSTLSYIFYLRYKIVQKQMFNRLITQLGNSYFQEHAVKCHVETDSSPSSVFVTINALLVSRHRSATDPPPPKSDKND